MRVLAIETTDQTGSVAALDGARILRAAVLEPAVRSAVSLAPALASLLELVGWRPTDVGLVAVASGPGSFTGLRVGVTTAKMFAYAAGVEVIGVNTLEVLAWQAPDASTRVWAVIDALRSQVFAARFVRAQSGAWQPAGETILLDDSAWLRLLAEGDAVLGPGLVKLRSSVPSGIQVVEEQAWRPRAQTVGQLGLQQWRAGRRDDLQALVPSYFRPSAAEEKRTAREAAG